MRNALTVVIAVGLVAALAPVPASAQQPGNGTPVSRSSIFDLRPGITKDEFKEFTDEIGSVLRFRQLGDVAPLGKGKAEFSLVFANTPIDKADGAWNAGDNRLSRSMPIPQIVARYGVSNRVDMGAWAGYDSRANFGLVGIDARIAVLRQGPSIPVTVSVRPSFTSLVGPGRVWVGTMGYDMSIGRSIGPLSPYVGVAASSSLGIESSDKVNFRPVSTSRGLSYAGLSYNWRALVVSAEIEKGARLNYALRIGTRF